MATQKNTTKGSTKKTPEKDLQTEEKAHTTTPAEQKKDVPPFSVRIDNLVDNDNTRVKAYASVCFGGHFVSTGYRVVNSEKGLFVAMPQSSYMKDGQRQYTDQFYALTSEGRTALNGAILNAYEQELAHQQALDEALAQGPFEQKM